MPDVCSRDEREAGSARRDDARWSATSAPHRPLTGGLLGVLFAANLVSASGMHVYTAMLEVIARGFHVSTSVLGWIPTASMLGFVSGLLLLAPLADLMDKKRLIVTQMALEITVLAIMTAATQLWMIVVFNFLAGMTASTSQHVLTMAAQLASPERRGRAMGIVLSGMLLGILTGRLCGGVVAHFLGWRAGFGFAMLLATAVLPVVVKVLPAVQASSKLRYPALLWSLVAVYRRHSVLRRVSRVQALLGIGYGGFWATLAPMLAAVHHAGSDVAGLMGIPGAAGVLIAAPVGRWVDRSGPARAVLAGALLVAAAYAAFGFATFTIAAVVLGAMLLDTGIRSSLVANQSFLAGIDAAARARVNMLFMLHAFVGNGIGALAASNALAYAGWRGVVAVGLTSAVCAAVLNRWSRTVSG